MKKKETFKAYVEDTRIPGGSAENIKEEYDLDATIHSDGTLTVRGQFEKIESYLEDYSIITKIQEDTK